MGVGVLIRVILVITIKRKSKPAVRGITLIYIISIARQAYNDHSVARMQLNGGWECLSWVMISFCVMRLESFWSNMTYLWFGSSNITHLLNALTPTRAAVSKTMNIVMYVATKHVIPFCSYQYTIHKVVSPSLEL